MDKDESELLDSILADKNSSMALLRLELDLQDKDEWEKLIGQGPSLMPKEAQIKQKKEEVLKSVDPEPLIRLIVHANELMMKEAPDLLSIENLAILQQGLKRAYEITIEKGILEGKIARWDLNNPEMTLSKTYEFSDTFLSVVQDFGNLLFQKDRIEDALSIYRWLNIMDPYNGQYWLGVGHCYKSLCDLQSALLFYTGGTMVDPENIILWSHLGCTAADLGQIREVSECKAQTEQLLKQLNREPTLEELELVKALQEHN